MRISEFRKLLLGSWALQSYRSVPIDPDIITTYPMTKNATGIIMYTHDGYVSAQIMAPVELPPVTEEEPAISFTYFAYTGAFSLTDGRDGKPNLTHSMEVTDRLNWLGQVQVRVVDISGDILTLSGTAPANFNVRHSNSFSIFV